MLGMGFYRSPRRSGAALFIAIAAAVAACATGVEPDRSSLDGGLGGAPTGPGAGGDIVGSVAASVTTGPGPGSASASSTSGMMASSSTAATTGGGMGGGGMGGAGGAPPVGLHLQYKAADTNVNDNQIKPEFVIVNDSGVSVSLADLMIRYWFTNDGGQMNFFCDYAKVDCVKVSGAFVAASGVETNTALEVTFSGADVIATGMNSGEVKTRLHKTDFAPLDESNDYSFDPTKTVYTDWTQVGLYHNGSLVWGVEP
jgi:hypothetical protein